MNRKQGRILLILATVVAAVALVWHLQTPAVDAGSTYTQTVRADELAADAPNDAGHVEQDKAVTTNKTAAQDKAAPVTDIEAAPAAPAKTQVSTQDGDASSDAAGQAEHTTASAGESKAAGNEDAFVMPAGAECVENELLVRVDPTARPEDIDAVLAQTPGVASQSVSAEDVASGMVSVRLEAGTSVEDAINAMRSAGSSLVQDAQPNYVYHLAEEVVAELVTGAGEEGAQGAKDDTAPASEAATDRDTAEEGVATNEGVVTEAAEVAQSEEATEDGSAAQPAQPVSASDVEGAGPLEVQTPLKAATTSVNDAHADKLWNLTSARIFDAWDLAKCEGNVAVAVFDNGFYANHEDLKANIVEGSPYDTMGHDNDVTPDYANSHGTHVAGIVGAVANNGVGVAGASYNAKIVPVKVFDSSGSATTESVSEAYRYVMEHREWNVKVVNISLGGGASNDNFADDVLLRSIQDAYNQGIVTVGAACNESGSNHPPFYAYPSDNEYVVSVINLTGEPVANGNDASGSYNVSRSAKSNYNVDGQGGANTRKGKNISAPGSNVYSTIRDGYGADSGTSMAAPLVSGVIALEFVANPSLTASNAIDVLYVSAHDIGDPGWDREFGHGEVDAYAALQVATSTSSATAEISGVGTVTATLDLPSEGYVYDGTQRTPPVSVVLVPDGGTQHTLSSSDYTVSYVGNTDAGLACVRVVGANAYAGKFDLVLSFSIGRRDLNDEQVTVELPQESRPYTGYQVSPEVTVAFGGTPLKKDIDYMVAYKNNVNAGEATATITGSGNFCGVVTKTFTITPAPISNESVSVSPIADQLYTGKAVTPAPELTLDDDALEAGVDYDLSYENNVEPGTATVVATGKGNYAGSVRATFRIVRPQASYRAHVQRLGWQDRVTGGATSGTTGRSLRLESIGIELPKLPCTGGITYRLHLRKTGWQGWKSDGDLAGTTGKGWRSEAIEIKLTGDLSKSYDVYYRAHCQRFGWLGWARNGQSAGSVGCSRRLEAVEIVLVPKGAAAPGPTNDVLRTRV